MPIINYQTKIALLMFHFILWFSVAFMTLETIPIILFILGAIALAYEITIYDK